MTDAELLTILHSRIENGAINLQILHQGAGFTHLNVVAGNWGNRTGFETMAYLPIVGEL